MWDAFQREMLEAMGHTPFVAQDPALPDDPLLDALLRAAGRDRAAADAVQLARAWPKPAALRGDAGAKRALWPRLRRLRRAAP
ncbi:hypothetical protein MQC88_11990 [Luteimonas sp. 50]|uniref:Uncharacterized protein n=1 Tax=Cognatiluteimonas sedimenti TaxID=2927791 RepID=A0ABT0A6Q4_9GAMM|nr:hypothetical protein [Lysobacter sedimenti]MCJ0826663.1 hypothetical protein [Lysobacter sedimenti]